MCFSVFISATGSSARRSDETMNERAKLTSVEALAASPPAGAMVCSQ